ncbi:MAG: hypothetical protein NW201_09140 [Gemmatimonadales bacterium]|nr:hypothetical protein [Gemmatimonadales bacterium]
MTAAGAAYCWGSNAFRALGDGTQTQRLTPAPVAAPAAVPAGVTYAQVVTGSDHSCGRTTAGAAYCWGFNANGQLGDGTTSIAATPVRVLAPVGVTFTQLAAGSAHNCGLTAAGGALCWGFNGTSQLGDGTTTQRLTPVTVAPPATVPAGVIFTQLSAGQGHSCGVTAAATYCWGWNLSGQLGDGGTTERGTPVAVVAPVGVLFQQVAAGSAHSCAATASGVSYCWGLNGTGQLGDGTTTQRNTPVRVSTPSLIVIGLGSGGSGTITSSPTGLNCTITNGIAAATGCSASFAPGTSVTLSSSVAGGNRLQWWANSPTVTAGAGGISGSTGPELSGCATTTCTVTVNATRTVGVGFYGVPQTSLNETFDDGNVTAGPSWSPFLPDGGTTTHSVVAGAYRNARSGAGGAGRSALLGLATSIPVTAATQLVLDVQLVSTSLNGGGLFGSEYPANAVVTVRNADNSETRIIYAFTASGGTPPAATASQVWVLTSIPAGTWQQGRTYTLRAAAPNAVEITRIELGGVGWDFVGLYDNVRIQEPPAIRLSRSAISASAIAGGANPAAETVTVTNDGGLTLAVPTIGTITYGASQPTGWLACAVSGTAVPFTVSCQATTGTLAAGTYTATVPVASAGASNTPRNLAVTFTVLPVLNACALNADFSSALPPAYVVFARGRDNQLDPASGIFNQRLQVAGTDDDAIVGAGVSVQTPGAQTLTLSYDAFTPLAPSGSGQNLFMLESARTWLFAQGYSSPPGWNWYINRYDGAGTTPATAVTAALGTETARIGQATFDDQTTGQQYRVTVTLTNGQARWLVRRPPPGLEVVSERVDALSGFTLGGIRQLFWQAHHTSPGINWLDNISGTCSTVGAPASVAISAGNNQSAATSAPVPIAPSVIVRDANNEPVPDVVVTFAVTGGGGSLGATRVVTAANGVASAGSWTLGPIAGSNTVTASVLGAGIAGSPVVFTASASAQPTLALSRGSISASAAAGGANPAPQTLTVSNAGIGTLATPTIGTITFGAGQPVGWLACSVTGTAAPFTVSCQATTGTLPVGTYTATVPVASAGATNTPQNVNVTFAVTATPQPTIALSRSSLASSAVVGGANPAAETVTVTNSGGGVLAVPTIGTIAYGASQPTGWLACTVSGTAAPFTVSCQATTGSLAAGSYTATVPIASAGATNTPQSITATFSIAGASQPTLALSRTGITPTAVVGGANPAAETVTVTNSGAGVLALPTIGTISYGAGQPTGWLACSVSGSAVPFTVSCQATTGSLAVGTYTATVPIASAGATNTPQNVSVSFAVSAPPAITLGPASVALAAVAGGANPAAETVTVTNGGGGALAVPTVGTITYGASQPTDWLACTVSGTAAPFTVSCQATTGSLTAGTYTATVPIASAGASNSPQSIAATFTVTASPQPTLALSRTSFATTATTGGANPAAETVTVTNSGSGALAVPTVGTITYGTGQPTGWLACTVAGTAAPFTVSCQATTGSLAAGTYTATVPIASAGASNTPQSIAATFSVTVPAAVLLASPTIADLAGLVGRAPTSTTRVSLTVPPGAATAGGLACGTITYAAGQPNGWLACSLATAITPAQLTLTGTLGSLAAGQYRATVRLTSTTAGVTPLDLPVRFSVQPPADLLRGLSDPQRLSQQHRLQLDSLGNLNGRYDLGDLVALLRRSGLASTASLEGVVTALREPAGEAGPPPATDGSTDQPAAPAPPARRDTHNAKREESPQ